MTLRASLLRELVNPNLSAGSRAKLCCELARDFESRGEYDEASEVLSVIWPRIGERPDLAGLERGVAGEVLLRAGVLTGIIGSSRQIADAQENKLRRSCAVAALSLILTVSAFAGIIHSPGAADPPPPPSQETSTSATSITTDVILTILGLIS